MQKHWKHGCWRCWAPFCEVLLSSIQTLLGGHCPPCPDDMRCVTHLALQTNYVWPNDYSAHKCMVTCCHRPPSDGQSCWWRSPVCPCKVSLMFSSPQSSLLKASDVSFDPQATATQRVEALHCCLEWLCACALVVIWKTHPLIIRNLKSCFQMPKKLHKHKILGRTFSNVANIRRMLGTLSFISRKKSQEFPRKGGVRGSEGLSPIKMAFS